MDTTERNTEIVKEHLAGVSQTASAGGFGVSRERIRQLLRRAGVPVDLSAALRRLSHSQVIRCKICDQPRFLESGAESLPKTCGRRRCLDRVRGSPEKYDREGLIQHLLNLATAIGYTPGQKDINGAGPPDHMTYCRYFGSLRAAQEAAGLKPNQRGGGRGPEPL